MFNATNWYQIIEDIRREKGISQREVMRRAGVTRSRFRHAMGAGGALRITDIDRILNVLGYELDVHPVEQSGGTHHAD